MVVVEETADAKAQKLGRTLTLTEWRVQAFRERQHRAACLPSLESLLLLWWGCLVSLKTRAQPVLGASWVADWPGSQRTPRQAGNNGELPSNLLQVHGPGVWYIWQASLSPGQRQYWHEPRGRGWGVGTTTVRGHPAPESGVGKREGTEAGSLTPPDPQRPALPPAWQHPAPLAHFQNRELTAPQGNLLHSQPHRETEAQS